MLLCSQTSRGYCLAPLAATGREAAQGAEGRLLRMEESRLRVQVVWG